MANVYIVVGLGFGDEGKGLTVAHLAEKHKAKLTVRFNGGAQAAHNVVSNNGEHHMFAQFGAGTFTPGCRCLMSKHTIIEAGCMLAEGMHLRNFVPDAFSRMYIDKAALVGTRFQMAANRIIEMSRGGSPHGSCGMGINETVKDAQYFEEDMLVAGDMVDPKVVREKLMEIQRHNRDKVQGYLAIIPKNYALEDEIRWLTDPQSVDIEAETIDLLINKAKVNLVDSSWLDAELLGEGTVVFEGAQGVLLDEDHGFMPHCTRSTTTFTNAETLLPDGVGATRVGVLRSYLTRHGAGPMPTEDPALIAVEAHNEWNQWQAGFRAGHVDLVLIRYALKVVGVIDQLMVTHCDKIPSNKVCSRYKIDGAQVPTFSLPKDMRDQLHLGQDLAAAEPVYTEVPDVLRAIEGAAQMAITYKSYGPSPKDVTV
jgi:adenylosuccinate synthase